MPLKGWGYLLVGVTYCNLYCSAVRCRPPTRAHGTTRNGARTARRRGRRGVRLRGPRDTDHRLAPAAPPPPARQYFKTTNEVQAYNVQQRINRTRKCGIRSDLLSVGSPRTRPHKILPTSRFTRELSYVLPRLFLQVSGCLSRKAILCACAAPSGIGALPSPRWLHR